ncbi:MAG: hydrogenase nickel incorporation protein HypB [Alphaproteobacteria bacterium]|nr:hydrogenase nickel incorporation protein HypB [Alphaproteobacteria bacterium]
MCAVCGCGHAHDHHAHGHSHDGHVRRPTDSDHANLNDDHLIAVEKSILSKNDRFAEINRRRLAEERIFAVNLVSSPGAGKTTLLVETVKVLSRTITVGVIEGDQATTNDADRIRATGVKAVQINTGSGCHLDAHMVGHALDDLSPDRESVLFIENVGNLVCPASFDLGEAAKVVILSVTEGDDKPLKYPNMFAAADFMILSKIDLLPYVDFDIRKAIERAQRINPDLQTLELSVRDGTGMAEWLDWILANSAGGEHSGMSALAVGRKPPVAIQAL